MVLSPKTYQFFVSVFASFGSILYGYDLGVVAEVIACDAFKQTFHNPSTIQTGVVVSLFTGGAFFGAGFAGPAGDHLGRRLTIFLGGVIFIIGATFQTAAQTIDWLYGGRAIAGLGVGFLVMIIPIYQSEIAHPSIRGRVTALQQFMLGIGSFVAGWLSYGTYLLNNTGAFRIPLGIQIIPALILVSLILIFPESPRWLISHGRKDEGLQTLAKLHAHGNVDDPWVRAEFAQIEEAVAYDAEHEAKSYMELFKSRSSFRRLLIACSCQASCQMTGVSAIQYYSVAIYGQVGISGQNTLKYQAINNILALLAQASCVLFIDKVGRRWALIGGNLVNSLMFMIATILIAVYGTTSSSAGWGFIISTWLYNISFSATCGPLSFIIPAEIFDTHTRSKGVSIATMVSFAFNTMIGQVTDPAIANIGWKYYMIFIIFNFTNAVYFWLTLPETKLLPLEEMNYLFNHAPWIIPGADRSSYTANLTEDLERRAGEIREKGLHDTAHEEHADEN
ncbi:general substrate transporter [Cryphonectria parasitica EP155]|uniref:General substrate transporter n=1 Tax=Cryphonectria parasitica (strain ATCC 38755 / EP155) TaxID=660469 RepID=A0A9P5CQ52_CRYP1|nr:general substrate transporter [Cryphonectria parasitica EP155]KAF3765891.1 general substrate transporter [Cryphonectria parasitica EP155]